MGNLEKAGSLLRLMGWLSLIGLAAIFAAILIPVLSDSGAAASLSEVIFLGLVALVIPAIYLITGRAVKQGKKWGKVTAVVIGCVSLLNFPIGTVVGIATFFYLKKGWGESSASTEQSRAVAAGKRGGAAKTPRLFVHLLRSVSHKNTLRFVCPWRRALSVWRCKTKQFWRSI